MTARTTTYRMMFVLLGAFLLIALVQASCADDETSNSTLSDPGSLPTEILGVDSEATLKFEDQNYRIVDLVSVEVLDANEAETFAQVGTATEATIPLPGGEIAVYRRDNDGDAIYTPPVSGAPAREGGAETWLRWVPQDEVIENP